MKNFFTLLLIAAGYVSLAQTDNYKAGFGAGAAISTGDFNTMVGVHAGENTTSGSSNSYFGQGTGYFNTSGNNNTFLGFQAGQNNNTSSNTFVGALAGFSTTTGGFNNFFGVRAGQSNTSGALNNFFGSDAGARTTTGGSNSFFGDLTGNNNTTGAFNTFLGASAGQGNTSGNNNVFIGFRAGTSSAGNSNNAFIGYQAGYYATSANNVFIGHEAGYGVPGASTGTGNIYIGYQAGYKSTRGLNNAFLGNKAGYNISTGGGNTFFGNEAGVNTTAGSRNVFLGSFAGQNNGSANDNVFVGRSAGANTTTGQGNSSLGNFAGPSAGALNNATAVGFRAYVSTNNALVLGGINGTNGATANTNVGIRTTAPGYALHVNASDAAKVGGGSWVVASDRRLKKDIEEFKDGIEVLEKMRPVWFRYNGKAGIQETEKRFVGVIAQEMQKVAPYTVGEFTHTDTSGVQEKYLSYDANAVTYLLVNSVKEQQSQITDLKAENASKQQQIDALRSEMAQLRAFVLKTQPGSEVPTSASVSTAAKLFQNEPNPFGQQTTIRYEIPETATSAQIKFYTTTGQEIHSIELTKKGAGSISVSNKQFAIGAYVYHLFVDGQSIGSKKLVLER